MIKSVTITNYLQESVKIELTEPETSGFIIRSIEGLGPAKANVNFTELATLDGALDNGALLNTRNIVMSLVFEGTPTIEDTRLKSYKYFPIKQNLTFEIETDNRHCFTVGRVESNTPTIFGNEREGCQISILCPSSYFQDMNDTIVNFDAVTGEFEFPFDNDSISRVGKNLVALDMARWTMNGILFDAQPENVVNTAGIAYKRINLQIATTIPINGGTYYLTGCPLEGDTLTYNLQFGTGTYKDTGNGVVVNVPNTSDDTSYPISLYINGGIDIGNKAFKPVFRRAVTIDGETVPVGENLLETSNLYIKKENMEFLIDYTNGTIRTLGYTEDPFELYISRLTNIPNGAEYILTGCPADVVEDNLEYSLSIVKENDVVNASDTGDGVTFTKDNDQNYSRLKLGFDVLPSIGWFELDDLPYEFYYGSAVVLDGEIHILGSWSGSGKQHYKWDGTSWTEASTLSRSFYNGSAVVLDDEIHILGGGNSSTQHYKWDGTSWTEVSTLPYGLYGGSAVVLDGEIHILGGTYDSTYHYKWDGESWTEVSTLPYEFYDGSAVVLDGEIHILGGYSSTSHYKWDGTSWTEVSTLPYGFWQGSAIVLNDEIHTFGGYYGRRNHYKWDGESWVQVSTIPYEFYRGSAAVLNGEIYIFGGQSDTHINSYRYGNGPQPVPIDITFSPMIRNSSIVDPTFEPPARFVDSGNLIEFGDINATQAGNIFYLGDSEVGVTIEIHAIGNASGIGVYRLDTNEMITINDTRLIGIVGSGVRAGDTIIINTVKGSKRVYFLRDGVYYNILNALNAPITWFALRKGDNGFLLNATYGISNLQYKITYRTLYEGV